MRQRRVLFVELKSAAGVVAAEQQDWLQRLMFAAGPNLGVYLWRPDDWVSGEVERVLRGEVPADWSTTQNPKGATSGSSSPDPAAAQL
jgi:hypothetical protein